MWFSCGSTKKYKLDGVHFPTGRDTFDVVFCQITLDRAKFRIENTVRPYMFTTLGAPNYEKHPINNSGK